MPARARLATIVAVGAGIAVAAPAPAFAVTDLRTPDSIDRNAIGRSAPEPLVGVVRDPAEGSAAPAVGGFDLGSAGIGALAAAGLVAVCAGGIVALRPRAAAQ
jgi:hypothetical protein